MRTNGTNNHKTYYCSRTNCENRKGQQDLPKARPRLTQLTLLVCMMGNPTDENVL